MNRNELIANAVNGFAEAELSGYSGNILQGRKDMLRKFGNYLLELNQANGVDKSTESCHIQNVSTRYFLFSGRENGNATKYLVDDCDDRETAIAKIETEYPDFNWVMTEEFNGC